MIRRTPLARVGRRKKGKARARAEVCRIVRERDGYCVWRRRVNDLLDARDNVRVFADVRVLMCTEISDVHEIVPRSIWPDGDLEPDNCVLLCRNHHDWIDSNRDAAELLGLFSRMRP